MKKTWLLIEEIVGRSPLDEKSEQPVVLSKLDHMIGANALEYKYPIDSDGLTEEEFAVYRQIVRVLNESKPLPKLKNINDNRGYDNIVKAIMGAVNQNPPKTIKSLLIKMEGAWEDMDIKTVNATLKQIEAKL